jgi:hypothetical protein
MILFFANSFWAAFHKTYDQSDDNNLFIPYVYLLV